jgi:MFS family permease
MGATLAQITALLFSAAILLMGNGLQSTLLPLRAGIEVASFNTYDIGVLGSSYYLGFAAGCFFGPHVIRRVGHIRAFAAMVAIASTAPLAHALFPTPLFWWIMRGSTGFCFAVLFMIIESWLNEKATNKTRGMVFSVYTVINLTVMTAGQLMINIWDPISFRLFALASILVSIAAVPLVLTKATAPAPIQTVKIRILHLYRLSPIGVIGALLVGMQQGAFWSLAPVFADGIGLTLIFAFFYGMTSFPLYSLCAAHMNDHIKEGGFVEASSGLLLTFAAGAIIGPLIVSPVMVNLNIYGLFSFTAGVQILLALFTFYRISKRAPVDEEDRSRFVDALRATSTVTSIDNTASAGEDTNGVPEASRAEEAAIADYEAAFDEAAEEQVEEGEDKNGEVTPDDRPAETGSKDKPVPPKPDKD